MTWNEAILEVLQQHEDEPVKLQKIYCELSNHPLVTDQHRKSWKPGLQPRYQCWIRRCLTNLIREGKVKRTQTATYQFLHS
ncbi:MAG: hypothetical protein APR62_07490 [Smithella sp. SDB]|nr:MAG: hypothetical protein APR62_07490 [Smithella sp. SDB]